MKTTTIFILLFIISVTNKIYASAWLIDSGKYKYTVTASNIDKNSKNIKQVRGNLFLQIQCKLAYLKDRIKLVNNSSALYNKLFRQIQFLERRSREISSYQDELMRIFAIEYGINKNQNLGIQLLYKENKFQGSNDMNYLSNNKEIGIFYKIKLFQNTNRIVSVQPRIYMTKDGCQQQFSYELLLLSAFSKKIRTISVFAESVFSFGQDLNNPYTRRSYYSFSISEGIEFQNGIMLLDFTKYYTRRNYGSIYNRTLYKQFSIAKKIKFGNLKKNSLTTQIGYFCDKSLINKHYKISGVIFSIWMDGCIKNINRAFLDILLKEQLLTDLQISHVKFKLIDSTGENDFFNVIIAEGIINNEMVIDILYKNKLLPLLNVQETQVKICDYAKIDQYVENGYFIYENDTSNKVLAINDLAYLRKLSTIHYNVQINLVRKNDFYQLLEQNFSHLNIIKSKYFLEFISVYMVAKNINYTKSIIIFFVIYFGILFNFKHLFHLINIICYFSQNILKIMLFNQAVIVQNTVFKSSDISILKNDPLPIYTILLPLYKESSKLKSIISYISNINYPKHKLDVKIIIEADDYLMIKESILYELPSYIHLLKVPFSLPRTKPKALNYAMQYCRGKYVVIYDAEDRPDADQLLKAVIAFDELPKEYVCLQDKLNFYNENENLLTKLFSIEYCLWFKYLLKGLSLMDLPVTLGGTSNHFKVDALQKIGFWDAYNVTEDADLGIRLYSFGYKVHMIDSYTLEESPINLISWINQRSRWIKGFIQTFLVFLAQKDKYKRFKFYQITTIFIFIGFSSYGFCCLPFLILTIKINTFTIINYLWIINSFFAFSYLYGSAFFILLTKKGKITNFRVLDIAALFVWPLYFLLHTIASYKAIWEIIFIPFKWDKTQHGISTLDLE